MRVCGTYLTSLAGPQRDAVLPLCVSAHAVWFAIVLVCLFFSLPPFRTVPVGPQKPLLRPPHAYWTGRASVRLLLPQQHPAAWTADWWDSPAVGWASRKAFPCFSSVPAGVVWALVRACIHIWCWQLAYCSSSHCCIWLLGQGGKQVSLYLRYSFSNPPEQSKWSAWAHYFDLHSHIRAVEPAHG